MPESAPAQQQFYPAVPQNIQGVPGAAAGGAGTTGGATGGGSPQTAGAALVGNLDTDVHSIV